MIVLINDLSAIRIEHVGQSIVFCSGSFDLLHPGHVWFLEQAKRIIEASRLFVAVGSDALIAYRKLGRPILNEAARLKMIDSLSAVDFCYLDTISRPEFPLAGVEHAFAFLKPHVYVIEDDAFGVDERRVLCERYGAKLHVLNKRESDFPEMSTTAIIEKIIRENTKLNKEGDFIWMT